MVWYDWPFHIVASHVSRSPSTWNDVSASTYLTFNSKGNARQGSGERLLRGSLARSLDRLKTYRFTWINSRKFSSEFTDLRQTSGPGALVANLHGGNRLACLDSANFNGFTSLGLLHGIRFNARLSQGQTDGFEYLPLALKLTSALLASEYTNTDIAVLLASLPTLRYARVSKPSEGGSKGGIGFAGWSPGTL